MVNRRYLRTKVMQALFARTINPQEDMITGEKKLTESIQNCYTLFLYFFSLFPELKRYRENKLEELKGKLNPSDKDLKPNTRFVDNLVIAQIENHPHLQKLWKEHRINWTHQGELIIQLYHAIAELPEFSEYMDREQQGYEEDKKLVLTVIEKVFVESQLLHWFFEEKNAHWFDDYNEALLMAYKNISLFKEKQGNQIKILPLFKSDEEKTFYLDLYRKTILHQKDYFSMIEKKLENWEPDRVLSVDMILMEMALCELTEFSTVPVKVIINEYIELAKTYSSAKSGIFINGILDKLILELKETGRLNKMGRGLIDN